MSQSESLKPCAHCGQKAWLLDDRPNDTWVECDNCQIGTAHGTFSEAIAAWNRRPSTADRGGTEAQAVIREAADYIENNHFASDRQRAMAMATKLRSALATTAGESPASGNGG